MEIDLPITVQVGRKNYALNLNFYRNAHYAILNNMKVNFTALIQEKVVDLPSFKSVDLEYVLYPKTKRLCDVSNICSIVDKFFCDALVKAHKIEDDNYQIVKSVSYKMGNIDPINPRVTVKINGVTYEDHHLSGRNREVHQELH